MSNLDLFIKVAIACSIIIICARIAGGIMGYIKQPRVVGEMIVGVLLGPTFLGQLFPEFSQSIFSPDIKPILFVVSNLGLSFYMFIVGMEMNLLLFNKPLLKQSSLLTLLAIGIPFLAGVWIAFYYKEDLSYKIVSTGHLGVFMGTALAITAFPMMARILQEKNIVHTKIGSITLLSASIQDVISWILLSFIISQSVKGSITGGFITLVGAFAFALIAMKVVKPLLVRFVLSKLQRTGQIDQSGFAIIVISLLISALVTDVLGLYSVFGGFILGLSIPRDKMLIENIRIRTYDFMVVFLLPLFFAFSGLNTDIGKVLESGLLMPLLVIVALAILTKIIPIFGAMKILGYNKYDSVAVSGLMNARGLMELLVANIGISYGFINQDAYSILVVLAVVSTLMATPIYEWAINRTCTKN